MGHEKSQALTPTVPQEFVLLIQELSLHLNSTNRNLDYPINTLAHLSDIASCFPELSFIQSVTLEKLVRKIDIAKRVWVHYESQWRRPVKALELAPRDYLLLAAILAAHAELKWQENCPELTAKWLNCALNCVDLAEKEGVSELSARVGQLLDFQLDRFRESS